jgi:hypothetical protein
MPCRLLAAGFAYGRSIEIGVDQELTGHFKTNGVLPPPDGSNTVNVAAWAMAG